MASDDHGVPAGPGPGPVERARHAEVDAKVLAEVGPLTLKARVVAESLLTGLHRSRNKGTSVEFAEHKEYSPGDNVRQLDWRALARLDRDYIKQFEDESNLRALLVVDGSGSMGYPAQSSRPSKLEYAAICAGALAYIFARQGDAFGLASYAGGLEMLVPARARRGQLAEVLDALEKLTARGPSRLGPALDALSEGLSRRTMVLLLSDLLDGGLDALGAAARLRARRSDVAVFHVLDRDELEFPFEERIRFTSLEDEREAQVDAHAIRDAYLEEMARFRTKAESACLAARIEYRLARTDVEPGRMLAEFLADRSRARAGR